MADRKLVGVLAEVEKAAAGLKKDDWRRTKEADNTAELRAIEAKSYKASAGEWQFSLVSFSIEDQGFTKGARGADGTAVKTDPPTVMRLPRSLAEELRKQVEHA